MPLPPNYLFDYNTCATVRPEAVRTITLPELHLSVDHLMKQDSLKCDVFDKHGSYWKMYMTIDEITRARKMGFEVFVDAKDPLKKDSVMVSWSKYVSVSLLPENTSAVNIPAWQGLYLAGVE